MRPLEASVACVAITVWLAVLDRACGEDRPGNMAFKGPSRTVGLNPTQMESWSKTLDVLVQSANEAAILARERPAPSAPGPAAFRNLNYLIPNQEATLSNSGTFARAPSGIHHIEGAPGPTQKGSAKESHRWAATPILDQKQVENFSDKELDALFKNGSSEIPGFDHKNEYQFCKGHTLVNAWNTNGGGYPAGVWPQGELNPLNNIYGKQWFGKIMVTNETNYTTVWNLVYSNHTIALHTQAYTVDKSLTGDGEPSMMINYNVSEDVWARVFLDEVRRVGPDVWIGKVYIQNIVESLLIQPRNALEEAALDFVTVYTNNTQQRVLNTLGLEGPNSRPHLDTGVPYPLIWFVLTCRPHITPALHYLPTSRLQSAMAAVFRYNDMGTDLPEMTHTYYDPGAVDNPTGFIDGDGNWPEARAYGFKPSDLGQIGTIPGLAPLPNEATILEDPRNVIEGRRPVDLASRADAPVAQTPTQAALARLAAESHRQDFRSQKLLTAAVSVPVQTVSDAIGRTQTIAAALAKLLSTRTETISQQLGMTDFNNAVRGAARPLIESAGRQAQVAQRFGETFNSGVANTTSIIQQRLQQSLAPAVNASQAITTPAIQVVNAVGKQAADSVGAGIELLGPGIVGFERGTAPVRGALENMNNGIVDAIIGTSDLGAKAFDGLSRLTEAVRRGISDATAPLANLFSPVDIFAVPALLGNIIPGLP
eukprot:jgi/Botrbrau1/8364/Bobra.0046s0025.1